MHNKSSLQTFFNIKRLDFLQNPQKQCLSMKNCKCQICEERHYNYSTQASLSKSQAQQNCLQQFLKQFPSNIPLLICPTTFYKPQSGLHIHYSNGNKVQNKNFILKKKTQKLLINFSLANNIHIFGNCFSKLMAKYQLNSWMKKLEQKNQLHSMYSSTKKLENLNNGKILVHQQNISDNLRRQNDSVMKQSKQKSRKRSLLSNSFNSDQLPKITNLSNYSNQKNNNSQKSIKQNETNIKIIPNHPLMNSFQTYEQNPEYNNILLKNGFGNHHSNRYEQNNTQKKHKNQKKHKQSITSNMIPLNIYEPFPQNLLYIQAYYPLQIPHSIEYSSQTIKNRLDSILLQHIEEEKQKIRKALQNYSSQSNSNHHQIDQNSDSFNRSRKFYQINQQFWQWVFKQYGVQTFAYFVTQFYIKVYNLKTQNIIKQGIFEWVFEKNKSQFGDNTKVTEELGKNKSAFEVQFFIAKSKKLNFKIKLLNVKNLKIDYRKNLKTFEQEYQQIILQKINSTPSQSQKKYRTLLNSSKNKKSYIYSSRLETFQGKIRQHFLKQQNRVLKKVEDQKSYEGQHDSNQLAKLLIPGMENGQYKNIRQILNNQQAFDQMVLYQQKKKQKERIKKVRLSLLKQKIWKNNSGNIIQEQSKINKKNTFFNSRKIRIKTESY